MKKPDTIPLQQITAFDAAARHLGFSRAAQELNVQQPAISHQVAMLENRVGTKLFLRTKPQLTLTADGESLAAAVAGGLDAIRAGLRDVQTRQASPVIVVNAALGFTSLYLLPRLAEFQSLYPGIGIEVVTRDQNMEFDPDRCDVAVVFGENGLPGTFSRPIFAEELIPVCKPGYLSSGPVQPEALLNQRLLHMRSTEHANDWAIYFGEFGKALPTPPAIDRYFSFMVYLRAIQTGGGIGLGWRQMIEEMVETGALEIASTRTVATGRGYHCCIMPSAGLRPEARIFLDWLCGEA